MRVRALKCIGLEGPLAPYRHYLSLIDQRKGRTVKIKGLSGEPGTRSDQQLEKAVRKGDRDALREVLERHGPAVLALTQAMSGDTALAHEIAGEVFATFGTDEGAGRGRGELRTRLMQLARAKVMDSLAGSGRSALSQHLSSTENVANRTIGEPIMRINLPPHLSPEEQRVVTMTFFGGLTYREVAQTLGLPERTVLWMLRGALQQLRPSAASVGATLA